MPHFFRAWQTAGIRVTAEIAILNRDAVALAADSAMTVAGGKTYPTNKMFRLSHRHPVGIMVYNNPLFMGAPLETLIKLYRNDDEAKAQATIEDYPKHFFEFLHANRVTNDEQEQENLRRLATEAVDKIHTSVIEKLNQTIRKSRRIRLIDERKALSETIEKAKLFYDGLDTEIPNESISRLQKSRPGRRQIRQLVETTLRQLSSNESIRRDYVELVILMLTKSLSDSFSGIVFAGFGQKEIFPSVVEVRTDGFLEGELLYQDGRNQNIARNGTNTAIVPFAQSEMVNRFMEGVDPRFVEYVNGSFDKTLTKFAREIVSVTFDYCQSKFASKLSPNQKRRFLAKINDSVSKAVSQQSESFAEAASKFSNEDFVVPILDIVKFLPKDELANMAEALVSLTSLKRRVSSDHESVGGPIDVAVISKGDGFVWIKRKRYFQAELN